MESDTVSSRSLSLRDDRASRDWLVRKRSNGRAHASPLRGKARGTRVRDNCAKSRPGNTEFGHTFVSLFRGATTTEASLQFTSPLAR
jgi:hypothetical protein